ncbi:MAG: EMC3/TMCO1 family protein [Candidatus Methanomethylophilaceae archaeon]|nr:EMC3/TMCO1 family protein [Candidatus Methanomethylophilaceae archaeon]
MAEGQPQQPPMPDMGPMKYMMITMIVILLVYFIDGNDHVIGALLDPVFGFLSFGGEYPILTLMLAGVIMSLFTTLLRAFTTDQFEQAKSQHVMSEFNKERRKAMMTNNTYAIKKLDELQPVMMAKNMEVSQKSMKTMPYTMIVIIPLFLWVRYYVNVTLFTDAMRTIVFPWASVNLLDMFVFPVWVFVYMLISVPLGQVINKIIRWYLFKKKLAEIENGTGIEVS